MTLLVGICCDNGIVLAADQQASRSTIGALTVGSSVIKISEIKDKKALFGFSGFTGLGHQIETAIESTLDLTQTHSHAIGGLQVAVRGVILPAMQMANVARTLLPNAQTEAICGGFLAAHFADGLQLFEFSPQGAFDPIKMMKWACIGSGQPNADPFMAFLWNVFWEDREPTLQEAIFTAYWATKTTIDSRTFGVGYSADVFVLSETDGTFGTRQLSRPELEEMADFIQSAKSSMREFRDQLVPTPQTEAADKSDEPPAMSDPEEP
jgi:20S proteasome alpha/beta subunit